MVGGFTEVEARGQAKAWEKEYPDGYVTRVIMTPGNEDGEWYGIAEGYPRGNTSSQPVESERIAWDSRSEVHRKVKEWMAAGDPDDPRYMHPREFFGL